MTDAAATVISGQRAYKLPRNLGRRLGRSDRSQLAIWFWELDRVLMSLIMVLIAIGLICWGIYRTFVGFVHQFDEATDMWKDMPFGTPVER